VNRTPGRTNVLPPATARFISAQARPGSVARPPTEQEQEMNPTQKALVQHTFIKVVPIAEQAAALFYGRLFEIDPALRPLFKGDLKEQGKKLMQMIGYCVGKLDTPEELLPAARALGMKHVSYGVTDKDYATVASALLWTLEKGLGAEFTPPVKEAWTAVYQELSTTMRQGARSAP
jgi:hemoglobin-like flavoprotein